MPPPILHLPVPPTPDRRRTRQNSLKRHLICRALLLSPIRLCLPSPIRRPPLPPSATFPLLDRSPNNDERAMDLRTKELYAVKLIERGEKRYEIVNGVVEVENVTKECAEETATEDKDGETTEGLSNNKVYGSIVQGYACGSTVQGYACGSVVQGHICKSTRCLWQ